MNTVTLNPEIDRKESTMIKPANPGAAYRALYWTLQAASTNKTRPHLACLADLAVAESEGVLFMAATDSYRLHVARIRSKGGDPAVNLADVPLPDFGNAFEIGTMPKFAAANARQELHGIEIGESLLTVTMCEGAAILPCSGSAYPDIRQWLGDIDADVETFGDCKVIGATKVNEKQRQNLPARVVEGRGRWTMAYDAIGENDIGVNPQYLADVCSQKFGMPDTLEFQQRGPSRPMHFATSGLFAKGEVHLSALVMPIRLNN